MFGLVYYALCSITGKFYVGQTTRNLERRRAQHYALAKIDTRNNYFMRALRKYDRCAWEWKVLGYVDCQFELDTLEKNWIWIKDSMSPDGYNTKEGGSHGKHTEKACKKMSEKQQGHISWNKGLTKKTDKRVKNISKAKKGKHTGANHWNAKAVKCMKDGKIKVYDTISEAARETGVNRRNIWDVLNGKSKRKSAGGFHWKLV